MKCVSTIPVVIGLLALALFGTAFGDPQFSTQPHTNERALARSPEVPDLPFPDNPDPDACGIPQRWVLEDPAWLAGYYEGKLVQPMVFLYDSHLRRSVTGRADSGTQVRVLLFQDNPTLNFYLVRTVGENPQEGWIPAPFLRFEPPA